MLLLKPEVKRLEFRAHKLWGYAAICWSTPVSAGISHGLQYDMVETTDFFVCTLLRFVNISFCVVFFWKGQCYEGDPFLSTGPVWKLPAMRSGHSNLHSSALISRLWPLVSYEADFNDGFNLSYRHATLKHTIYSFPSLWDFIFCWEKKMYSCLSYSLT